MERFARPVAVLMLAACSSRAPEPAFVFVPGGGFTMGAAPMYPEEGTPTQVFVSGFLLKAHEVTNAEFAVFVRETGYVTEAERNGGSARFVETATPHDPMSWWHLDPETTWRAPAGAGSNLHGLGQHPVVHVTIEDARQYAIWAGGRLPQEVEWEYAATRGLADPKQPESGALGPDGSFRANVWTGTFPSMNTAADGHPGTAPVGAYPPDANGAYDLIGNVWEWTETPFAHDPTRRTIKGGSHLCATDHCRRFRPAARQGMEPDFSTSHIGFRILKPLPGTPLR
ncbi:MAG: SUMF1/EgtB/PvdO family nonheme iron enzyme [Myxococcota bacterium]